MISSQLSAFNRQLLTISRSFGKETTALKVFMLTADR